MVTIQDVAGQAGVSRSTVSRVINDNPKVNSEIRERVLQAVDELGYRPNRIARRLRARSGDLIGLIISDIQNPFFGSVIRAIENIAYEHQMNILLCNTDEDTKRQDMYLRVLEAESIAGVIVVPADTRTSEALVGLHQRGIPVVTLDRDTEDNMFDLVKSDNVNGTAEAITHLLNHGYRRIGLIDLGEHVTNGMERFLGYKQALEAANIALNMSLVRSGDAKIDGGYTQARELLGQANPPDALFVANNLMTLGALRALREMNLRIPDDIALIGFDDMPWSEELYVPLTTVAQRTYDLGVAACQRILKRIERPDAPRAVIELPTRLVIRESCGSRRQT